MHFLRFRSVIVALFCLVSHSSIALTVNRLNGGANIVYVDFSIPASVLPLELVRSYNSITGLNENNGWLGAFGWGWTCAFETTMTVTPERNVILRDGATGNTVLFRSEKEDPKIKETFFQNVKRAFFERKLGRKVKDSELKKSELPDKIFAKLRTDAQYRALIANRYGIKNSIPRGEVLISSEYGYQTIQFKNNSWVREKGGISQIFDKEGRLIKQIDKNGFYFDYRYSSSQKLQLIEIKAADGTASLKFSWTGDKIAEVTDNRNLRAKYSYDSIGNLTQAIDSNNQVYIYKYENRKYPHLLTRIEYPTESTGKEKIYRQIRYDDNGLVVAHREKDGSETTYTYGKSTNDPENDFWTKSIRKARGSTDEQYDEYFIKTRNDGSKYLYKQELRANGETTVTLFTACCGKPSQTIKNGEVTTYKYLENGLLSEKIGPKEDIRLEYDPRWKKVTKVNRNGTISTYEYDSKGNLVRASNNKSQRAFLKYDRFGRIVKMTDAEGKWIDFKYGAQGKRVLISEKGIGAIRIEYDNEGRIVRTEGTNQAGLGRHPSEAKSQEVIRRVMKGLQQLIDIVRPAGLNGLTS